MAELETQIRQLADRRFAATRVVPFTPDETQVAPRTRLHGANTREVNRTETIKMRSTETVPPRRRRYLLGAAAAVIATSAIGIALVARDSDPTPTPPADTDDDSTTPLPTLAPVGAVQVELTGADGNAEAHEAFEVIVDAFEAFNRGDAMAWVAARAAPEAPPTDSDDYQVQYVEAAHAAGARYDVRSCEYDGFGESRGELRGVDGHRFTCRTKLIDRFTEAAGLDYDEVFTLTVADGRIIDGTSTFADLNNMQLFMLLLDPWVEREHPEIAFTAIEWYGYPLASEVPAVLAVVDEFVASNDAYPFTYD